MYVHSNIAQCPTSFWESILKKCTDQLSEVIRLRIIIMIFFILPHHILKGTNTCTCIAIGRQTLVALHHVTTLKDR